MDTLDWCRNLTGIEKTIFFLMDLNRKTLVYKLVSGQPARYGKDFRTAGDNYA